MPLDVEGSQHGIPELERSGFSLRCLPQNAILRSLNAGRFISEERWNPVGSRSTTRGIVLHSLESISSESYRNIHGTLPRLRTNPSELEPEFGNHDVADIPRRAPWGMHYLVHSDGDITKLVSRESAVVYGAEMGNVLGAESPSIIGGRVNRDSLRRLGNIGQSDIDDKEALRRVVLFFTAVGDAVEEDVYTEINLNDYARNAGVIRFNERGSRDRAFNIPLRDEAGRGVGRDVKIAIRGDDYFVFQGGVTDLLFKFDNNGNGDFVLPLGPISESPIDIAVEDSDQKTVLMLANVNSAPFVIVLHADEGDFTDATEKGEIRRRRLSGLGTGRAKAITSQSSNFYVLATMDGSNTVTIHPYEFAATQLGQPSVPEASGGSRSFVIPNGDHAAPIMRFAISSGGVFILTAGRSGVPVRIYRFGNTFGQADKSILVRTDEVPNVAGFIDIDLDAEDGRDAVALFGSTVIRSNDDLQNPRELRMYVSSAQSRSILAARNYNGSYSSDTQNFLNGNDKLTYTLQIDGIDWRGIIPEDEDINVRDIFGAAEIINNKIRNGPWEIDDDDLLTNGNDEVIEIFRQLPNRENISFSYVNIPPGSINDQYDASLDQALSPPGVTRERRANILSMLLGRFVIDFGLDGSQNPNPIFEIEKKDIGERLYLDESQGRGDDGVIVHNNGDVTNDRIVQEFKRNALGIFDDNFNASDAPSWANDQLDLNAHTISILLDIHDRSDVESLSDADDENHKFHRMWRSLAALVQNISTRLNIEPIGRNTVTSHARLNVSYDGLLLFPWDALFDYVEVCAEETEMAETKDVMEDEPEEGARYAVAASETVAAVANVRRLKRRRIVFEAGLGEDDTQALQIDSDDVRIKFDVETMQREEPKASTVELYNLSPPSRELLRNARFAALWGGYDDDLLILKSGEVQESASVWDAPEWVTTLVIGSRTAAANASKIISVSLFNTSYLDAARYFAEEWGLALGVTSHLPQDFRSTGRNFAGTGTVTSLIERYFANTRYSYVPYNGTLYILENAGIDPNVPLNEVLRGLNTAGTQADPFNLRRSATPIYHIATESGMIGAPVRSDDGMSVSTRLNGLLSPGQLVEVTSFYTIGQFRIYGTQHQGDTWTGDFRTTIHTVPEGAVIIESESLNEESDTSGTTIIPMGATQGATQDGAAGNANEGLGG